MKGRMIFFSISMIVIFSMVLGLTSSTAQTSASTTQPRVAQAVPLWKQVNSDGFGDSYNQGIYGFEIFNDHLYTTSGNWNIGAQVWRLETNGTWVAVSELVFGSSYALKNRAYQI